MSSRRRPSHRVLAGIIPILWLLATTRAEAFRHVKEGDPAPPLVVEDLGGMEVKRGFSGRLTVVLFLRPEQRFSQDAMRDLEAIHGELKGAGIEIIAVADIGMGPADAASLSRMHGVSYPVFIDRGRQAQESYGVIVFPSTGIVGKDGRLVFYQPSRNSNYKEIIGGELKVLLGLAKQEEFAARMAALGEVFGEDREAAEEIYRTAVAHFESGKKDEAAGELARAIHLYPELSDAHLQLGYVLLELGEPEAALKEFEYVRERNPVSPSVRTGVGIARIRMGQVDEGIRLLEEAISLNPDPVRGYAELGKAYEGKGEIAKALYCYRRAISKLLQGRN